MITFRLSGKIVDSVLCHDVEVVAVRVVITESPESDLTDGTELPMEDDIVLRRDELGNLDDVGALFTMGCIPSHLSGLAERLDVLDGGLGRGWESNMWTCLSCLPLGIVTPALVLTGGTPTLRLVGVGDVDNSD